MSAPVYVMAGFEKREQCHREFLVAEDILMLLPSSVDKSMLKYLKNCGSPKTEPMLEVGQTRVLAA